MLQRVTVTAPGSKHSSAPADRTSAAHFHRALSREVLRAIRGRRSQVALARRLGYRGNPITDWERGERWPTAAEVLRVAAVCRLPVREAFSKLVPLEPPQPTMVSGRDRRRGGEWKIHAWLTALRGNMSNTELAERMGVSRYVVSRWCSGVTNLRFYEFLQYIDALTGRVEDWIAHLVSIEQVPSLATRHQQTRAARRIALEQPWTEAILRVIETERYREQPAVAHATLAATLGITEEALEQSMAGLVKADIVTRRHDPTTGHVYFEALRELSVDTRADPEAVRTLQEHWLEVALRRAERRENDWFAYNVFSCSEADLARIREDLKRAFRESRAVIATSQPTETAGLLLMQFVQW